MQGHLYRQDNGRRDAGTGTKGRLTAKDLLNEAEKLLMKTGAGLSLYDRLRRDEELRDDVMEIL